MSVPVIDGKMGWLRHPGAGTTPCCPGDCLKTSNASNFAPFFTVSAASWACAAASPGMSGKPHAVFRFDDREKALRLTTDPWVLISSGRPRYRRRLSHRRNGICCCRRRKVVSRVEGAHPQGSQQRQDDEYKPIAHDGSSPCPRQWSVVLWACQQSALRLFSPHALVQVSSPIIFFLSCERFFTAPFRALSASTASQSFAGSSHLGRNLETTYIASVLICCPTGAILAGESTST